MLTVEISWTPDHPPTDDQLFELCSAHGCAASLSPTAGRIHATLTVERGPDGEPLEAVSGGMAAAVTVAADYVLGVIPGALEFVDVMTFAEQDRRLELPVYPAK